MIGSADADILVSLKEKHRPTAGVCSDPAHETATGISGHLFYFLPADMVTQILNFGLPAPDRYPD